MTQHPLVAFAKDTTANFDIKKFRDQVLMAVAVGITVNLLKIYWIKFTEKRK